MKKYVSKYKRTIKIWIGLTFLFAISSYIGVACGQQSGDTDTPAAQIINESSFCPSSSNSFSPNISVTGVAQFNIRQSSSGGLGNEVSGGFIRYAEVQALNSAGQIIQCTTTDNVGSFTMNLPASQSITIKVNSRASGSKVNVSVLDTPSTNAFYSVSSTVSTPASGSVNIGTITASAKDSTITGGAFNIYNNILRANESLRFLVCGGTVDTTCAGFSVAPKVIAYWKAGVNPYVYFGGDSSSGISFYVPGTGKLYILGGIDGDTDSSDTDHFDDAVISHEYGHFIEDNFAKTDSPGGSHDGNHVLDARLTWGEGWANFFSSAVRGSKIYRDTYGNVDGVTGCYFNYDIDKNQNGLSALDVPSTDGEGNFREFAITRALFDGIDPYAITPGGPTVGNNGGVNDDFSGDSVDNSGTVPNTTFARYWNVFTNTFPSSTTHFRNVGLFLLNDNDTTLKAGSPSALSFQKIKASVADYGQPLPIVTGPSCAGSSISITANDPSQCLIGGQQVCVRGNLHACCSNQFASNDFYDFNHDGSVSSISIHRVSGSAELDMYLYKEGYTFGTQSDIAVSSNLGSGADKTINVSSLPHGHYMLNINVYTGGGNPATSTYQIFINGNQSTGTQVCP